MDETTQQFMDITGCNSLETTQTYLNVTENDLNSAVTLYFETNGQIQAEQDRHIDVNTQSDFDMARSLHNTWNQAYIPSPEENAIEEEPQRGVQEIENEVDEQETEEEEEEEEEDEVHIINQNNNVQQNNQGTDDGADEEENEGDLELPNPFNHTRLNRRNRRNRRNNRIDFESFRNQRSRDPENEHPYILTESIQIPGNSEVRLNGSRYRPHLDQLRRNVLEVGVNITFEQARTLGNRQNKYILLFLFDFAHLNQVRTMNSMCSNQQFKELIEQYFVTIVFQKESEQGRLYTNFYPVRIYPHLAIIDARTGERMKVWSNQLDSYYLSRELKHFLNKNSLNEKIEFPNLEKPIAYKSIEGMTEEEQIEYAIETSLSNSTKIQPIEEGIIEINSSSEDEQKEVVDDDLEFSIHSDELKDIVVAQGVDLVDLADPADDVESTRIQFRLPDNTRIVKKFALSKKVSILYYYVKSQVEKETFELFLMNRNLKQDVDKTIQEANLKLSSINVVWD